MVGFTLTFQIMRVLLNQTEGISKKRLENKFEIRRHSSKLRAKKGIHLPPIRKKTGQTLNVLSRKRKIMKPKKDLSKLPEDFHNIVSAGTRLKIDIEGECNLCGRGKKRATPVLKRPRIWCSYVGRTMHPDMVCPYYEKSLAIMD